MLPLKGATRIQGRDVVHKDFSTHALIEGSALVKGAVIAVPAISTHAPIEGSAHS